MRNLLSFVVLALIIGGCDSAVSEPAKPAEPSPEEALRAEAAKVAELVKAELKDPDSVRFRNVRRVPFMGMDMASAPMSYCGEVNARNAFGGYVGFQPFVVSFAGKEPPKAEIADQENLAAQLSFSVLCMKDKKPIPGETVTLGS